MKLSREFTSLVIMEITFLPNYKIIKEASCSLEQVKYAISTRLSSPGATNLTTGVALGSIDGNQFRLQFKKSGRNFWRPEFKGSFSRTNNHVAIVVRCGVTAEARVFTDLYLSILVVLFLYALNRLVTGHVKLNAFSGLCSTLLVGFGAPWVAFWSEFRYDRVSMESILDSIARGRSGENE